MKTKRKAEPERRGKSKTVNNSGGLSFSEKKRLMQLKHILSGKGKEKEKPKEHIKWEKGEKRKKTPQLQNSKHNQCHTLTKHSTHHDEMNQDLPPLIKKR